MGCEREWELAYHVRVLRSRCCCRCRLWGLPL